MDMFSLPETNYHVEGFLIIKQMGSDSCLWIKWYISSFTRHMVLLKCAWCTQTDNTISNFTVCVLHVYSQHNMSSWVLFNEQTDNLISNYTRSTVYICQGLFSWIVFDEDTDKGTWFPISLCVFFTWHEVSCCGLFSSNSSKYRHDELDSSVDEKSDAVINRWPATEYIGCEKI